MQVGDEVLCLRRQGKNPLVKGQWYKVKLFTNIGGLVLEGYESWVFRKSDFKSEKELLDDSIF